MKMATSFRTRAGNVDCTDVRHFPHSESERGEGGRGV